MVSGSEKKALEIVYENGGETTSHKVSCGLGIDTGYARLLCMNLARKDYVDLKRSGRFKITYKGEKALGKTSNAQTEKTNPGVRFKRPPQEHLGWGVLANAGRSGFNTAAASHESGQDELLWTTTKIDGSGRHCSEKGGAIRDWKLLTETTHPCGFCKAKGEKPKGTACSVCRGSGKASLNPPAVICAFCKGRGEEKPRSNITCTVCRGKGFVSVTEPFIVCSHCRGKGSEPNNKLPCLKCKGKGVIPKMIPRKEVAAPKAAFYNQVKFQMKQKDRIPVPPAKQKRNPTASEIEVLQVYYEARRRKKAFNISNYTGMSPAYVGMMTRSLVENGLLTALAPRKYEITPKGIKFFEDKGGRK